MRNNEDLNETDLGGGGGSSGGASPPPKKKDSRRGLKVFLGVVALAVIVGLLRSCGA